MFADPKIELEQGSWCWVDLYIKNSRCPWHENKLFVFCCGCLLCHNIISLSIMLLLHIQCTHSWLCAVVLLDFSMYHNSIGISSYMVSSMETATQMASPPSHYDYGCSCSCFQKCLNLVILCLLFYGNPSSTSYTGITTPLRLSIAGTLTLLFMNLAIGFVEWTT